MMPSDEPITNSFIIRIWLEETPAEGGQATWRGHITHVSTSERLYLRRLDDISTFIAPYLEEQGVRFGLRWRLRRWAKRQRESLWRRLPKR